MNTWFNSVFADWGKVTSVIPLFGGDINQVFKVTTSYGPTFCIKVNSVKNQRLDLFEKEDLGLQTLASTNTVNIPEVIRQGKLLDKAYLILEYLDKDTQKTPLFWSRLGHDLAQLHKTASTQFGFTSYNYIGSLKQLNDQKDEWFDFFVNERIRPQMDLALQGDLIGTQEYKKIIHAVDRLKSVFTREPPSLLHGDLWSGNILSVNDKPYLIDPAVYYGHREMDIAMTRLFGGFTEDFYNAYTKEYPLQDGWEGRLDFYNLYPLLVHLNLFGRSYLSQILTIVQKID